MYWYRVGFERLTFELMLTYGIILLYIIYYYYILYYTLLFLSYSLLSFPIFLFQYSSLPLQSFSSQSISFLFPLPKLILFFPPHLISSPFTILSFKVYVSVLTYTYLYSINISPFRRGIHIHLPFQYSRQFDPACFIGVDG